MKKIMLILFLLISSFCLSLYSHEESKSGGMENSGKRFEIRMPDAIFDHLHNKIVHFTVALSIAAFLFTLLNFRFSQFDLTIMILVALSAVAAAASYFTGNAQAVAFKGDPVEWVINLHRAFGTMTAAGIYIWLGFLLIKPLKKFSWIIGAVVFILVLITGFYGGVIAAS
jgi:uncharacterized membrane protein